MIDHAGNKRWPQRWPDRDRRRWPTGQPAAACTPTIGPPHAAARDVGPPVYAGPPSDTTSSGHTMLTVRLTDTSMHAPRTAAQQSGDSRTDVVNRALQVYLVIDELYRENGAPIGIWFDNGRAERLTLT